MRGIIFGSSVSHANLISDVDILIKCKYLKVRKIGFLYFSYKMKPFTANINTYAKVVK